MEIVTLEDDPRRIEVMKSLILQLYPDFQTVYFPTSNGFIDYLSNAVKRPLAICLDHDLEPVMVDGLATDAGTGRDAVEYLITQSPFAPVLIHSTNSTAALGMVERLKEFRWDARRVYPYNDLEWIEEMWFPAFRKMVQKALKN